MEHRATLAGRRVLLPRRPDRRLADALRAAGAGVDEVDLVARVPAPGVQVERLAAELAAGGFDWLVITSAFTVEALGRLGHPLYSLVSPGLRIAAVGDATAAAVRAAGGWVDLVPVDGAGGRALASNWPQGSGRVAIPGAVQSAQTLPQALRALGWEVVQAGVYRTSPVASVPAAVVDTWRAGGYDALVATAGSVARSAAALLGTAVPVVAIGERSARESERLGFTVVTARSPAGPHVVAALAAACAA